MLKPLQTLWRESMGLYLRTSATVLEVAAEGLKSVESIVEGSSTAGGVDLRKPLEPETSEGRQLLEDLQANILKGHGRDHAMHLLVCFGRPGNESEHGTNVRKIRAWIGGLVREHVTSAAAQWDDKGKVNTLTTLLLSSQGYEFLGERRPHDGAFREGMQERGALLDDRQVAEWQEGYRQEEGSIHALVIVAARVEADLEGKKRDLEVALISAGGFVVLDERGRQERDGASGRAIEHFGYADGVSQPRLIASGTSGARKYDQRAPLNLVLERDRHSDGGYGSYLVYRKLEQDVDSFCAAVGRVAAEIDEQKDLVGAMAVGRFKDGTPVATYGSPKPGYDPRSDEDFDYDDDPQGSKCPLHAHVRKANPRGSLGFLVNILARDQERRIARRGITYTDTANGTVGLLFMCFQSDIRDQFEFIQRSWANNPDFSENQVGQDPVIGQSGSRAAAGAQQWPTGWGSGQRKSVRFDEHVRLLGGEYFFAPSMSGLAALSGGGS